MREPLAILGTGALGEALLSGLLGSGMLEAQQARCAVRREERAAELADRYGVEATTDPRAAAEQARMVVLAVKPQQLDALLAVVGGQLRPEQTVLSLAAGVPTARIEAALPDGVPVVRAMVNTPARVGQAASVVAAGRHAGPTHLEQASGLLGAVGVVIRLPEHQLDAVTGLSGSGPAYLLMVVEAMVEAGVLLGLPRSEAATLAVQTLVGTGALLRETGQSPAELRAAVTSPGGTTAAGLRALERAGLRAAFADAVEAAARRSAELSGGGEA